MTKKLFLLSFSLLLAIGLAAADNKKAPTKLASGVVKAVSADSLTLMQGAQEFKFVVDGETRVVAKGASHKTSTAKEAGKATGITDFVKDNQSVTVRYREVDGKLHATEVRPR